MEKSIIKNQMMKGPLFNQDRKQGKGQKKKMPLIFSLNLTALIDAFSMLVIFLLSNMSTDPSQVNANQQIQLPFSVTSEAAAIGTVVRVSNGQYFVDDKKTSSDELTSALAKLKAKSNSKIADYQALVIQGDRNLTYDVLSPILRAGGQAGFNQFRFAIVQTSARN